MAKSDFFAHAKHLPYGENIYWRTGNFAACSSAVDAWYREHYLYNYGEPKFSYSTKHFTQLIWKDSRYVGCASATSSKTGRTYVSVSIHMIFNMILDPSHQI